MCTSPAIATPRRVADSLSCVSTTSATRRTQWTPWTEPCSMAANCGCRWPVTADLRIRTTAAVAHLRAGMEAAVMDVAAEVPGGGVGADPEAGADPDLAADRATAVPNRGPARDPALVPLRSPDRPGGRSPSLRRCPDLVPVQDPGPNPEALHLSRRGNRNRDLVLRALLNLLKRKVLCHLKKNAAVSCLLKEYWPVLQILTDLADPPGTSFCGRVLEQIPQMDEKST